MTRNAPVDWTKLINEMNSDGNIALYLLYDVVIFILQMKRLSYHLKDDDLKSKN